MKKGELAERYACKCSGTKYGHNMVLKAFAVGWDACMDNILKDADGDDLPEYEREVIVLLDKWNGVDLAQYMRVGFAHRPDPKGWDGKSLTTGKVEHFDVKTYGKGGWNGPGIKYWLDLDLPK